MSFDFPSQPQVRQRRGGGCGRLIFMIVAMLAVWYMFSGGIGQRQKPVPQQNGGREGGFFDQERQKREDLKQDIFGDGQVDPQGKPTESGRKMPSTGRSGSDRGWEMEDVETKNSNDFRNDSRLPAPKSDSKNDWSIGDVDDVKAEAEPATRTVPRKKSKNDWSLEEVETK